MSIIKTTKKRKKSYGPQEGVSWQYRFDRVSFPFGTSRFPDANQTPPENRLVSERQAVNYVIIGCRSEILLRVWEQSPRISILPDTTSMLGTRKLPSNNA